MSHLPKHLTNHTEASLRVFRGQIEATDQSANPFGCRAGGGRRVAAIEILKSTLRTREYMEKGQSEGKTLLDARRVGATEGMQHFDGEIDKLIRDGTIDFETGMAYATNAGDLRLELGDFTPATTPIANPTRVGSSFLSLPSGETGVRSKTGALQLLGNKISQIVSV